MYDPVCLERGGCYDQTLEGLRKNTLLRAVHQTHSGTNIGSKGQPQSDREQIGARTRMNSCGA
ncbi:MAG: hypothetical protein QOF60_220 [Actinomycetota bacterium]|nr:hypothetical protein [Actinomycetota bacterium]